MFFMHCVQPTRREVEVTVGGTIDMISDRNASDVNVKSNSTSGQATPGVVQGATVAVALPAKKSIDYPSCSDESPIHLSCC